MEKYPALSLQNVRFAYHTLGFAEATVPVCKFEEAKARTKLVVINYSERVTEQL
jgi:hypothetical protein